ncbi:hypothetical protein [Phenylobacterium sp.]|uniref:hypothetical protein n=1 Tax=Phenylobacterium sp. TaxID=1871053 RepID=UPI0025F41EA0|nr:hypothetical protein [Phenylobacterium sp.]MCA3721967.1 hypothetical protein [Phenylobacterium sp.]
MRVQSLDALAWMYVQPMAVQPVSGAETVTPIKPAESASKSDMRTDYDRRPRDPERQVDLRV